MMQRKTRLASRRNTKKCKDCEHVIFNDQWGEYKCSFHKRNIRDGGENVACSDFKKRTKELRYTAEKNDE